MNVNARYDEVLECVFWLMILRKPISLARKKFDNGLINHILHDILTNGYGVDYGGGEVMMTLKGLDYFETRLNRKYSVSDCVEMLETMGE